MQPTQSDIPAEALEPTKASAAHDFKSHEFRDARGTLYFAELRAVRQVAFDPDQMAGLKPRTLCPAFTIRRANRVTDKKTGKTHLVAYRKPFKGWKKTKRVAWVREYRRKALAAIAEQKAAEAMKALTAAGSNDLALAI